MKVGVSCGSLPLWNCELQSTNPLPAEDGAPSGAVTDNRGDNTEPAQLCIIVLRHLSSKTITCDQEICGLRGLSGRAAGRRKSPEANSAAEGMGRGSHSLKLSMVPPHMGRLQSEGEGRVRDRFLLRISFFRNMRDTMILRKAKVPAQDSSFDKGTDSRSPG
jgi:hypothetical protein